MKIKVSLSKTGSQTKLYVTSDDSLSEVQTIIKRHLKPVVDQAKDDLAKAVKMTSTKVRAWALENLSRAKKLGRRTDLFQKLVNDPYTATNQLALHMMNMNDTTKTSEDKIDGILDSLKFG